RTRFARSRQRTETGELLHRGFRMQFVEIKKRTKETALAKRTAFRVQRTETGMSCFVFGFEYRFFVSSIKA
ncbi:hypothetical protein, partial [Leptospira borgpetersenii]|uniref:hypothetical protein n=1 Tax=Leptospira borgpetersenii TaxID=174 RepID=UPI001D1588A8